ncbi:sugar ABC transporter permease [Candidatus Acetothermia bacterium]|nr:sugar ABC transporter permease [Candidatus Acetothermia bacterium]
MGNIVFLALRLLRLVWARIPEKIREALLGYGLLFPVLLILGAFVFWPLLEDLALSLFHGNLGNLFKEFAGVANYKDLLDDPVFRKAITNTAIYAAVSVPITMMLALSLAVLLNSKIRLQGFFQTSFFLSYITPTIAAVVVWRWIYERDHGLLNYYLGLIGVHGIDWLNSPEFALPAVIIFSIWKYVGYQVVLFLAGLQHIDKQLYEASQVDGASAWARFRDITWPLLAPTTFFVLLVSVIEAFKVFDVVYALFPSRPGGPLRSALTAIVYLFQTAFEGFRLNYAAAAAFVIFVIIFILTIVQRRVFERRIYYE